MKARCTEKRDEGRELRKKEKMDGKGKAWHMGHMSQSLRYHENNTLITYKHSPSCPMSTFKVESRPSEGHWRCCIRGGASLCCTLVSVSDSNEIETDIYFLVYCNMWTYKARVSGVCQRQNSVAGVGLSVSSCEMWSAHLECVSISLL